MSSTDYRAFRGIWIPAEVWLSPDMTLQEKVMLVEINSLQHPERGCFKSNKALAEFFQLSASRVTEVIASLAMKGLVRVELIRNGKQVIERHIFMTHPFGTTRGVVGIPTRGVVGIPKGVVGNGGDPWSGNAEESNTVLGVHLRKDTRAALAVRPDDVDPETWTDFLAMRKAKRAPLTKTGLSGIQREADKARMTLQDALQLCCARGWQGFKAGWLTEKPKFAAGGQIGYASDEVD